jgi:hypothetical protein
MYMMICIHTHTHTHINIHVCVHICMYVYIHIYTHTHTFAKGLQFHSLFQTLLANAHVRLKKKMSAHLLVP